MVFSTINQLNRWWNIRGGYTFLKKELTIKPDSKDANKGSAESNDPEHQFLIQSNVTLAGRVEAGVVFRYIDKLSEPVVPAYEELDVRISWKIIKAIEVSVVAQNLINNRHPEFVASTPPREIERSVYGKVIFRF